MFFYVLGTRRCLCETQQIWRLFYNVRIDGMKLCLKQCGEKILCDECENTKWIKLDVKKIIALL